MFSLLLSIGLTLASFSDDRDEIRIHTSDIFHFGRFWSQIRELQKKDLLLDAIAKRRKEIAAIKEHWRPKIESFRSLKDPEFYNKIETSLKKGTLTFSHHGSGSAYFLIDECGMPHFVIKPIDEDILCLNNRKFYGSPYNDHRFRVRLDIPLYRSAQAEALTYTVAQEIGLSHMTPKTVIAIISNENFFDLSDVLEEMDREPFFKQAGYPDKEKLCSIQEFIPNMKELSALVREWLDQDLPNDAIEGCINQNNFEDAMILIWTTYDTDAHAGNIHVRVHPDSQTCSLLKFDNGLTFPEKNSHFFNSLSFVPNARNPLSERARQKIREIPIDKISSVMTEFEMDDSIDAFEERMEILQTLNERQEMSIYEIDLRLRSLSLPRGRKLALSPISIEELEEKLFEEKKIKKRKEGA